MEKKLLRRRKHLLAVLQKFGGKIEKTDFQKYLFSFQEKLKKNRVYDFVPYNFGSFSFVSYADLNHLQYTGEIIFDDYLKLKNREIDWIRTLSEIERDELQKVHEELNGIRGDALLKKIYLSHPYFAIKSKVSNKILSSEEHAIVKKNIPTDNSKTLFTIGYEGKSLDFYLNLLLKNNVKVLCDVRRNAISRKYGFSKKTLSTALKNIGVLYIHIPELGIISEKRKNLKSKSDYKNLFDEYESLSLPFQQKALREIKKSIRESKRVSLTCFEADHQQCHRNRIAKVLFQKNKSNYKLIHL